MLSKAYLYADPFAYSEGVLAALHAVEPLVRPEEGAPEPELAAAGSALGDGQRLP